MGGSRVGLCLSVPPATWRSCPLPPLPTPVSGEQPGLLKVTRTRPRAGLHLTAAQPEGLPPTHSALLLGLSKYQYLISSLIKTVVEVFDSKMF